VAHGPQFTAETSKFAPELLQQLNERGLNLHPGQFEESGLQGVARRADGEFEGGTDPRREGVALGF